MLMNNLTDQTKLFFIKKDGHPNTVLHNCGPVKIHAKITSKRWSLLAPFPGQDW